VAVRAAVLATAVVVTAVCGDTRSGPATDTAWQGAVDTIADTITVRTLAGSVWGDTARLVETLRIGSLEGADAYVLGDPVALAATDTVIYVLDAHVPVVRAYDAKTGEHRLDIGREGGGPGEYGSPDGLALLPDGRLLVRDPATVRINEYAPDGTFLEGWAHPNGGGFHTYRPFYVDTTGTSWVTTLENWGAPPWEWQLALIGVSPDGAITDTVPAPRFGYEEAVVTASREGSASRRQVPFTPQTVWSFSPRGYMVGGVTETYSVYLFRPDAPVLRIVGNASPVPVHPEEGAEQRERITAGLQRQYGSWRWNGPGVPDTKPPYRDLFVDTAGRVWVVVSQPGEPVLSEADAAAEEQRTGQPTLRYREPPAFDVFDAEGRYLGHVAPPPTLMVEPRPLVRDDVVWGVEEDALGVRSVVRYQLRVGDGR
jgi:hypothetical protein